MIYTKKFIRDLIYYQMPAMVDAKEQLHIYTGHPFYVHFVGFQSANINISFADYEVYNVQAPASGAFDVELTDMVRSYVARGLADAATLTISAKGVAEVSKFKCIVHDGCQPVDVMPPANPTGGALPIPLPSYILRPTGNKQVLAMPVWMPDGRFIGIARDAGGESIVKVDYTSVSELPVTSDTATLAQVDERTDEDVAICRVAETCSACVLVRWDADYGFFANPTARRPQKVLFWRLQGAERSTDTTTTIYDVGGVGADVKQAAKQITIVLDGLTAYDSWWYSDIVTAPIVKVQLESGQWVRASVTTKKAAQKATDKKNALAIDLVLQKTL